MFSTINEGIVALKTKTISELKPETEFLLEAKSVNNSSTNLDSTVDTWLTKITKTPRVLLIQGIAGSGKTQFCHKLTIGLWEEYLDDKPIPLYIKLASLTNPTARAIEETLEKFGFTQEQIIILKEQHSFIFILDGYDELYEFSNLHLTNGLNNWQAQTIITCRSEALYFIVDYQKYFVPFKANKRLSIGLQQIEINPLSPLQIEEFLNNHIKNNQNGITHEELTNIPGLLSLVQTPLLLKAILAVQKYSLISPIDFYNALIEARFLWQEQKLKLNKQIGQAIDFKRYFWSYCKSLALKMQELGTTYIYYKKSTLSLFQDAPEKSNWAKFLQDDNKIRYSFSACPLVKTKNNYVEFIDYCLIDYFVGSVKYDEEVELFPQLQPVMRPSEVESELESSQLPIIGRRLFTNQQEMIQHLVERVTESEVFKTSLFNYIQLSKTDERYAIAASNAITGLNFAHISFSGMDLSYVKIPGAFLNGMVAHNTNFKRAVLSGCSFIGSFLADSCFDSANLQDIKFGERPYLSWSTGCVTALKFFQNEDYLAVAGDPGSLLIYELSTGNVVESFSEHRDRILSLDISNDEKYLVTSSYDKTIRLYNLEYNDSFILVDFRDDDSMDLRYHEYFPVAFSPQTNFIFFANQDLLFANSKLFQIIYDPLNRIKPIILELTEYMGNTITKIITSYDNLFLSLCVKEKGIKIWSIEKEKIIKVFQGNCCSFSSNNKLAVAVTQQSKSIIQIFNLLNFELECSYDTPQTEVFSSTHNKLFGTIRDLRFSPNNNILASAADDGSIFLWDAVHYNKNPITKLSGHNCPILCISFSSNGQLLASGTGNLGIQGHDAGDRTIRIWNIHDFIVSPFTTHLSSHQGTIGDVKISQIKKELLTFGEDDGYIKKWNIESGLCLESKKIFSNQEDGVEKISAMCLMFPTLSAEPKKEQLLVISREIEITKNIIKLFCLNNNLTFLKKIEIENIERDYICAIDVSPDNKLLVIGGLNHIAVFNILIMRNSTDMIIQLKFTYKIPAARVAFFTDKFNKLLLALIRGNKLIIIDGHLGKSEYEPEELKNNKSDGFGLGSFSISTSLPKLIACIVKSQSNDESSILIWDIDKKEQTYKFKDESYLSCLAFSPDAKFLVTGYRNAKIVIWDIIKQEKIYTVSCYETSSLTLGIKQILFLNNYNFFTIQYNGTIQAWNMTISKKDIVVYLKWHVSNIIVLKNATFTKSSILDQNNATLLKQLGASDNSEKELSSQISSLQITEFIKSPTEEISPQSLLLFSQTNPTYGDKFNLGVCFDIEKLNGESLYGVACWKIFFLAIQDAKLINTILSEGDTNATFAGKEQVYCIRIESRDRGLIDNIQSILSKNKKFKLVCANQAFIDASRESLCNAGDTDDMGNINFRHHNGNLAIGFENAKKQNIMEAATKPSFS